MTTHSDRWMGGWTGGNMGSWTVLGLVSIAWLVVVLGRRARK